MVCWATAQTIFGNSIHAVEIYVSFKDAGDAFFGERIYASQKDSREFESIKAVLYNNYNFRGDDPRRSEFFHHVFCCIPTLVDYEDCFDVRERVTPEMKHGLGKDRNNIPLAEGRDVLVLRIKDDKDSHIHAHRDCMCPSGK